MTDIRPWIIKPTIDIVDSILRWDQLLLAVDPSPIPSFSQYKLGEGGRRPDEGEKSGSPMAGRPFPLDNL
jgi:hypothetical protein